MKTLVTAIALFLLSPHLQAGFENGNSIAAQMREHDKVLRNASGTNNFTAGRYVGYVHGVWDIFEDAEIICPKGDVTSGQIRAIAENYILKNPARWGEPGFYLIGDAFKEAFPCPHK